MHQGQSVLFLRHSILTVTTSDEEFKGWSSLFSANNNIQQTLATMWLEVCSGNGAPVQDWQTAHPRYLSQAKHLVWPAYKVDLPEGPLKRTHPWLRVRAWDWVWRALCPEVGYPPTQVLHDLKEQWVRRKISGVYTTTPTLPLIQRPKRIRVSQAWRRHRAKRIWSYSLIHGWTWKKRARPLTTH